MPGLASEHTAWRDSDTGSDSRSTSAAPRSHVIRAAPSAPVARRPRPQHVDEVVLVEHRVRGRVREDVRQERLVVAEGRRRASEGGTAKGGGELAHRVGHCGGVGAGREMNAVGALNHRQAAALPVTTSAFSLTNRGGGVGVGRQAAVEPKRQQVPPAQQPLEELAVRPDGQGRGSGRMLAGAGPATPGSLSGARRSVCCCCSGGRAASSASAASLDALRSTREGPGGNRSPDVSPLQSSNPRLDEHGQCDGVRDGQQLQSLLAGRAHLQQ